MELLHQLPSGGVNWVDEGHSCLRRGPVSLLLIASEASRHEVIGCGTATPGLRDHMVNGVGLLPTVLADVLVPLQNTTVALTQFELGILDGLHTWVEDAGKLMDVLDLVEGLAGPGFQIESFCPLSGQSLESMTAANCHHWHEMHIDGDHLIPQSLLMEPFTTTHHGCTFVEVFGIRFGETIYFSFSGDSQY